MSRILVINPGGTSTKVAVFEDATPVFNKTITHAATELTDFERVFDQRPYRTERIFRTLDEERIDLESIDIIMARGGLGKPMEGGVYGVSGAMIEDMKNARYGEHASNLGCAIAKDLAEEIGVNAYVMDPVSVDEMNDVARLTGLKEIPRVSLLHALNSRCAAREAAKDLGKAYEDTNLITAHLGAGISVVPHEKGKMIDCNNPMEMGPFCPDRAGGLPSRALAKLCFSGKYTQEALLTKISREGGLYDHLGTKDLRDAEQMAAEGDEYAALVIRAMSYQIAKEIGAMATALSGEVDAIVLTGGMANSRTVVQEIEKRTAFIAKVIVKAGEFEMEALAEGGCRLLHGETAPKEY